MSKRKSFFQLLTEAIKFFAGKGFTSKKDLTEWVKLLRESAGNLLPSQKATEQIIRRELQSTYSRLLVNKGALKLNPGVSAFTVDKLKPKARAELQRRVMASVNLIKLNREEAIATTLRRFEGWVSSVPTGGSEVAELKEIRDRVRAPMARMDFIERRVVIDQNNKFAAAVQASIAANSDAIAAQWNSQWKRLNYDYREDHKERDQLIYAIRDNWAIKKGLMKAGSAGYTDQITAPAEEVYCRCTYSYIYGLRSLPDEMLTAKGREFLASTKK